MTERLPDLHELYRRWQELRRTSVAAFAAAKDADGKYVEGPLLDEAYRLKADRQKVLATIYAEGARVLAELHAVYKQIADCGGPY